jgi:hypothetical protein
MDNRHITFVVYHENGKLKTGSIERSDDFNIDDMNYPSNPSEFDDATRYGYIELREGPVEGLEGDDVVDHLIQLNEKLKKKDFSDFLSWKEFVEEYTGGDFTIDSNGDVVDSGEVEDE